MHASAELGRTAHYDVADRVPVDVGARNRLLVAEGPVLEGPDRPRVVVRGAAAERPLGRAVLVLLMTEAESLINIYLQQLKNWVVMFCIIILIRAKVLH
jgi:hypothetical protein